MISLSTRTTIPSRLRAPGRSLPLLVGTDGVLGGRWRTMAWILCKGSHHREGGNERVTPARSGRYRPKATDEIVWETRPEQQQQQQQPWKGMDQFTLVQFAPPKSKLNTIPFTIVSNLKGEM
ncbi:hypothetical protein FRB93_001115 [Tulasnella sp. JGI-2019a]|nr:hypothetical protein FRB93_001115 [Tulasnella sp. JGI-2019a]